LVREWAQKDGVDHRENRGVGANAQSEQEDRRGGEAGVTIEGTKAAPKLRDQVAHGQDSRVTQNTKLAGDIDNRRTKWPKCFQGLGELPVLRRNANECTPFPTR
jgi:hypothetical protein